MLTPSNLLRLKLRADVSRLAMAGTKTTVRGGAAAAAAPFGADQGAAASSGAPQPPAASGGGADFAREEALPLVDAARAEPQSPAASGGVELPADEARLVRAIGPALASGAGRVALTGFIEANSMCDKLAAQYNKLVVQLKQLDAAQYNKFVAQLKQLDEIAAQLKAQQALRDRHAAVLKKAASATILKIAT